jgi:F0F1-type ATP synthase membrane subunit c/vacuolar-type H+-ATPase subunit K
MDGGSSDDRKRNYFLWGTALTWALSAPLVIGIFHSFRGISEQKATGLGAVAGGLAESYAIFGLVLALVLPVGAIVLLVKSFASGHRVRALFSLLYICWSTLTLAFAGLFVWLSFSYLYRHL